MPIKESPSAIRICFESHIPGRLESAARDFHSRRFMPRLCPGCAPVVPQLCPKSAFQTEPRYRTRSPRVETQNLASLRVGFAFRRSDEDFESFSISHLSFADDQTEQRREGRIKIGLPLEFIASCLYNAARSPLERLQTMSISIVINPEAILGAAVSYRSFSQCPKPK